MKVFLAQCLDAAASLDRQSLRRPLSFLFTADEETGSAGAALAGVDVVPPSPGVALPVTLALQPVARMPRAATATVPIAKRFIKVSPA